MRQIKFRGKRLDTKEWVYGYLCPGSKFKQTLFIVIYDNCWEVSPENIGQYTSIKDKHDKEIYEGDCILAYGKKWHIIFSEGSFVAKCRGEYRSLRMMYGELIR